MTCLDRELMPATWSGSRRMLNVASISTLFPSAADPHRGVFVERRLNSLAEFANVRVVQPIPWFPVLRSKRRWGRCGAVAGHRLQLIRQPMFYIPGVLKRLDSRWLERSILPILRRWRRELSIDLIDAHFGYPEGVGSVRAASQLGLPVFLTLRGNETKYLKMPSIGAQLVSALECSTGIVAVSQSLKAEIVASGISADKIAVIPNAVDTRTFQPGSQSLARNRLGLPTGRRFLISVGHLVYEKGHHLAIVALRRLRNRYPDLDLIIVGGAADESEYPDQLRVLAAELGLADAVRFVGIKPPNEIATWLQAADAFVLATYREGCCNAVLEALACGLPVVTTSVGDNSLYVKMPQYGCIVPVGYAGPLSHAIESVLSREWNRAEIAESISRRGGWSSVASQVARFFEARLAVPPPG